MQNLSIEQYNLALQQSELSKRQAKIAFELSAIFGACSVENFTQTYNDCPTKEEKTQAILDKKLANESVYCGSLKFTDKEISSMPQKFRKEFRVDGCTAHIRRRSDSRYNCSYEIRYRRNGYNISVSAQTIEEAKEKFIKKIQTAEQYASNSSKNQVPTTFNEFALFWFENFHKRKVVERTYKTNMQRFNHTLKHRFEKKPIKIINAKQLQDIVDEYVTKGQGKTAEEVHSLLNQIFKCAVKFALIPHNPVDMIFREKHEREHGVALTLEEESLLLSATTGTRYQCMFAVALYTGMRPNEYKTAIIKGNMIVARNSKRKNGKIEYKRIPIIKKLRPYLEGVEKIEWVSLKYLREKFNSILPNHILKDLRKTFNTHCVTSKVDESARKEMMGHSGGTLYKAYTELSDEFLYEEAAKLDNIYF